MSSPAWNGFAWNEMPWGGPLPALGVVGVSASHATIGSAGILDLSSRGGATISVGHATEIITGIFRGVYGGSAAFTINHPAISSLSIIGERYLSQSTLECTHPQVSSTPVDGLFNGWEFGDVGYNSDNPYGDVGIFGTFVLPQYNTTANVNLIVIHPVIAPTSVGGLFGWWKFATDGRDSTNLGHTATLALDAIPGPQGLSGFATVSDDPFDMRLNSFSVSTIIVASTLDNTNRNILSKRNNSSYRGWSVYLDSATRRVVVEASDTGDLPFYRVVSQTAVTVATAVHVAVVFDRSTNRIYLYINGVLEGSVSIAGMADLDNTLLLAFGEEVGQGTWLGTLGDIRFYKRALSQSEVLSLSNGVNLYGDIGVFGTFVAPAYHGNTLVNIVATHPIIVAHGIKFLTITRHSMISYITNIKSYISEV